MHRLSANLAHTPLTLPCKSFLFYILKNSACTDRRSQITHNHTQYHHLAQTLGNHTITITQSQSQYHDLAQTLGQPGSPGSRAQWTESWKRWMSNKEVDNNFYIPYIDVIAMLQGGWELIYLPQRRKNAQAMLTTADQSVLIFRSWC